MKSLYDFIVIVPDVISQENTSRILSFAMASEDWRQSTVYSGNELIVDGAIRNSDVIRITTDVEMDGLDTILFSAAEKALRGYAKALDGHEVNIRVDTGYDLLRYKTGCYNNSHVDHCPESHRNISCSFAINDDYEGGEWSFFGGEYVVKAPAGSAVLFPSNFVFPHAIKPVTGGTRYSIVTWFI